MSDVDQIRAAGWTQGSVLVGDMGSVTAGLEDGARYLVISHPCDVVSVSLERDPTVELLRIEERDAPDGNLTYGKNPRRLHLQTDNGVIAVDFVGRQTIDRSLLAGVAPQSNLSEDDRRLLAAWLSARYGRPAFADEFNRRLSPAMRGIDRILKTAGTHMSAIYVATALAEFAADTNYQVRVAATMRSDDFADAKLFATVSESVDKIGELIAPLDGIDLVSIQLFSEEDVSIDALRSYARWDYDALSFRDGDEAVHPARV